jgi:DNA end-binding protein Ku
MAARSIASLTVSFGLVSIPVRLFSATEATKAISFNLLHKGCGSRLKQQYICVKEEVPVAREDMVKGYEFAKDQYVLFSPEELKALEEGRHRHGGDHRVRAPRERRSRSITTSPTTSRPTRAATSPMRCLAKALRESKRCALGRWAARGKQYIVMIRAVEHGLVMQQLMYAGEVRPFNEIEIPPTEVKDAELKLAKQLIDAQTSKAFDPTEYTDTVAARIHDSIEKKVAGQEITMTEAPETGAQVIDLMEALRASLEKKGSGKSAKPESKSDAKETRKGPKRVVADVAPVAKKARSKA